MTPGGKPKLCPKCQRINPGGRKTCLACGTSLKKAPLIKMKGGGEH
jgi:hypothetical protein